MRVNKLYDLASLTNNGTKIGAWGNSYPIPDKVGSKNLRKHVIVFTSVTVIVDKDDFFEKLFWCVLYNTVNCMKEII